MYYREVAPTVGLTKYIRCFWVLKQPITTARPEPEIILPDGCPEIVFNLAAPFRRYRAGEFEVQPQTLVAGQIKQRIFVEPSRKIDLFGVRFQPNGIYPLIKQPLAELTDKIEDICLVLGKSGQILEQKILNADAMGKRISIFENFVRKAVGNQQENDLVNFALKEIVNAKGLLKIDQLVKALDINQKTLERCFNREVGVTPKFFSRIVRIQEIVRLLNGNEFSSWTDIAYSFKYVDQSHFINDFRAFTGSNPSNYLTEDNPISDSFIG